MVEVNDKVFVAPLYGQKDNIAVITGPAGAGAVLNEGNYNTWTLEWFWDYPLGREGSTGYTSYYIDEPNSILYIWHYDSNSNVRFGTYNLANHTTIFESTGGSDYIHSYPLASARQIQTGVAKAANGISRSIQTYLALFREQEDTIFKIIEVWKNGALLWTYDTSDDYQEHTWPDNVETFCISLRGQYILAWTYYADLILYKGSYVEP